MRLGEKANPWILTPDDWHENGVPWGDYCKCDNCGLVARSTNLFDYYADGPGLAMKCENCLLRYPTVPHDIANTIAEKIIAEDN